MWLSSIVNSLSLTSAHTRTSRHPSPRNRLAASCRPRLEWLEDRCLLSGVVRSDNLLDVVSTLPHYSGLPAQLDVHEVSPADRAPGSPVQAAILVHGRTIDGVAGFDLRYQDYSLQESMARAGIDTFSV